MNTKVSGLQNFSYTVLGLDRSIDFYFNDFDGIPLELLQPPMLPVD